MASALRALNRPALLQLAGALRSGRLTPPYVASGVGRYVASPQLAAVVGALTEMADLGMGPAAVAHALELLAEEREATQQLHDRVDLVWTGPEVQGCTSRDTGVVVRELLATATRSVLIASYAIDQPHKGRALFEALAARMDSRPQLGVRMFFNIKRKQRSERPEPERLREFSETFRNQVWPGKRLPQVFYDPRSLEPGLGPQACLHAKCVVVDDARVLVSSANFTEAAQERNIEAGVLLADPAAARAIRFQFDALVLGGVLRPVVGLG